MVGEHGPEGVRSRTRQLPQPCFAQIPPGQTVGALLGRLRRVRPSGPIPLRRIRNGSFGAVEASAD